jgi:hypothetical protein
MDVGTDQYNWVFLVKGKDGNHLQSNNDGWKLSPESRVGLVVEKLLKASIREKGFLTTLT